MMRNWNEQLYFGAMPGTESSVDEWKRELADHGIARIVCLTPHEEILTRSPTYAKAREIGGLPPVMDVPIPDFQEPLGAARARFWQAADAVKTAVDAGERVCVHCGAGVGRTGMFAVAVLLLLGYDADTAECEVARAGSFPEVPAQLGFLRTRWGLEQALESGGPPKEGLWS